MADSVEGVGQGSDCVGVPSGQTVETCLHSGHFVGSLLNAGT